MKSSNKWLMQIINPITSTKLTIYESGLVYGTEPNKKLFILTEDAITKIKKIIERDIHMLKTLSYVRMHRDGRIIKLNYPSRNRKYIKVVGWAYEREVMSIISNSSNYSKCFTNR